MLEAKVALEKKTLELEEKTSLLSEYEDLLKRKQAEFENYRKRVQKEMQENRKYATSEMVLDIIHIIDDFERALQLEHSNIDAFQKGTEMIYNKLQEILHKRGLREIESLGKPFDPMYHEAVMQKEVEDEEDGIIIEELQKGYFLNKRLIRPSMVIVSKNAG